MNNESTLTSLAMLRVNLDQKNRKDYLEYLVPFAIYILSKYDKGPINNKDFRNMIKEEFGLIIPLNVTLRVLQRLVNRKYINRENDLFYVLKSMPVPNIDEEREIINRHQDFLIHSFRDFTLSTYNIELPENKAVVAILSYLSKFSIACLKNYSKGTALPDVSSESEKDIFLVNAFVRYIKENSIELFDSFMELVKGNMLANALITDNTENYQRKFRGVTFLLDTPLVLHLLGLMGEYKSDLAIELINFLINLKGTIAIFSHTEQELFGVLKWSEIHYHDNNLGNPILDEMRRSDKTPSDLIVMRENLDKKLAEFNITIKETPTYIFEFQIDENELDKAIQEEINYLNPNARYCDINSIRSIYTLRRDRKPKNLEDSVAIFVTTNAALAQVAYKYGKEHESSREVSSVLTSFSLSNIAWLKSPFGSPDLPRLEVIANCYAAMEPSNNLWNLYLNEIDKLQKRGKISEEEYIILRSTTAARDELMNTTLGDIDSFAPSTIGEVLKRVKNSLVKEKDQEIKNERELRLKKEKELELLYKEREEFKKHIFWISDKISSFLVKILFILIIIILIIYSIKINIPIKLPGWIIIIGKLSLMIGLIWSILNWIFGITILRLYEIMQDRFRLNIFKWFLRIFKKDEKVDAVQL